MQSFQASQLPKAFQSQNQDFQQENLEQEGYSTLIVEDLLQGTQEWQNVQEIVRLTIKALTDVVKQQSDSIKELERVMQSRASKNELSTGLQLKANISDVSRTIAEVSSHLDQKLSFDDSQVLLKDYVLKSDISYLLSNKITMEEVRQLLDERVSNDEIVNQLAIQDEKFQEWQKELEKYKNSYVQVKDFENLVMLVENKADLVEVNDALEQKANKQTIQNAMNRKVNRSDIDNILAQKADISDLQNLLESLGQQHDLKGFQFKNQSSSEKPQQQQQDFQNNNEDQQQALYQIQEEKADKQDLQLVLEAVNNKVDKQDFELFLDQIQKLEAQIQNQQYDRSGSKIQGTNQSQVEQSQRFVGDDVKQEILQAKDEIYADLGRLREDIMYSQKAQEEISIQYQEQNKLEVDKINGQILKTQNGILEVQKDIDNLQSQGFQEKTRKNSTLDNTTRQEVFRISEDIQQNKMDFEDQIIKKLDKKDFIDLKSKMVNSLEQKVELEEVQSALNTCQQDITNRIVQLQNQFNTQLKHLENDLKLDQERNLDRKVDEEIFHKIVKEKLGQKEYNNLVQAIDNLNEQQNGVVSEEQFAQHLDNTKKTIDFLQKDLMLKANIKDVCTLLDTKSKIEDVNKALTEIHRELDLKPSVDDLNQIAKEQTIINESLCTENIVCRYTWKSGELKQGNLVPWEYQVVNTLPDNFLWEKDKTSILIVAPGLYQISTAFFVRKNGNAQVFVNGEPIFQAIGSPNFDQTYNPKKAGHKKAYTTKEIGKHPGGNITGISLCDFIVLPSRSRISVTFEGDVGTEGFIGVKRL